MSAAAVVTLAHVRCGYDGRVVLDDVNLTVGPTDYLAIIGPNGGGKTTLIKVMLGLIRPWSGTVALRLPPRRGSVGYVPQHHAPDPMLPLLTAEFVLTGRLGLRGPLRRYDRSDRAAVASVLERLDAHAFAQARVSELSGGQLQRALIARALVSDPALLVLDEPLASIDAVSRSLLQDILRDLNRRIPIVLVTHDTTAIATDVKQIACVNQHLWYHGDGKLDAAALEEAYGCPVELFAHGVPHRVAQGHDHAHDHAREPAHRHD